MICAEELLNEVDNVDIDWAREYVNKISNRSVKVIYTDEREDEFLMAFHTQFLIKLLTEGLLKNGIVNLFIGKKPSNLGWIHLTNPTEMILNSDTGRLFVHKVNFKI